MTQNILYQARNLGGWGGGSIPTKRKLPKMHFYFIENVEFGRFLSPQTPTPTLPPSTEKIVSTLYFFHKLRACILLQL